MPSTRISGDVLSGRINKAIDAKNRGDYRSLRAAARAFDVPYSTLAHRAQGRREQSTWSQGRQILSTAEEEALVARIDEMHQAGHPSTIGFVGQMAQMVVNQRHGGGPEGRNFTVGTNWASRFLKRHPDLKSRWTRSLHNDRAKAVTYSAISAWLDRFTTTCATESIETRDIYNMDETGFNAGHMQRRKAVVVRGKHAVARQPNDRSWFTSIECVSASGVPLQPQIIFKGKAHMVNWYNNLPDEAKQWRFSSSPNGWSDKELALDWLKNVFEPGSKKISDDRTRLLILDGHLSHTTPEFFKFCREKSIKLLILPPHTSHVTQPLDVSIFGPLKTRYSQEVEKAGRNGIEAIPKSRFISLYCATRHATFTRRNISSAFRGAGLVPLNRPRLLDGLTPPPPSRPSTPDQPIEAEVPRTPKTARELAEVIGACQSPPSPSKTGRWMRGAQRLEGVEARNALLEAALKEKDSQPRDSFIPGRGRIPLAGRSVWGEDAAAAAGEVARVQGVVSGVQRRPRRNLGTAGAGGVIPDGVAEAAALSASMATSSWSDFAGVVEF